MCWSQSCKYLLDKTDFLPLPKCFQCRKYFISNLKVSFYRTVLDVYQSVNIVFGVLFFALWWHKGHGLELMVAVTCAQGPAQAGLMELQWSLSPSQPLVGTTARAAWDACENTRGDVNFPAEVCNLNFPWWHKQEESTLGSLRTSS